jgi:hypothetical protein
MKTLQLLPLVLITACADPALRRTDVGGIWVSVGTIESSRLHTSPTRPEGAVPEQLESLFDLFWEAGCAGEQLRLTSLSDVGYPEVVCSLPGRSKSLIVVFSHIDLDPSDSQVIDGWATAASLPTLYRALGTEERTHTFVFAGFGEASRRESALRAIRRLADATDAKIDAVVDLRRLLAGQRGVWCYSADVGLRNDLFAVGLAIGRSPDSLRLVPPPDREGRSKKASNPLGRTPTITIGTFVSKDGARVSSTRRRARADDGEVLRLIAFFLGFIDQRLAVEPPAAEDLGSEQSPARILE